MWNVSPSPIKSPIGSHIPKVRRVKYIIHMMYIYISNIIIQIMYIIFYMSQDL